HKSGICIQNRAVRRGDIDSFLQTLKELRESRLVLSLSGDVPRQDSDAVHRIAPGHGVRNAIEKENAAAVLDPDFHHTRPLPPFEKAGFAALQKVRSLPAGVFNEIGERPADNLLERMGYQVGKAPVNRAHFSIQGQSQQNVIERVDQVAVTLLRALDDLKKLVEFLVARGLSIAVLDSSYQPAQLRHFAAALPCVHYE